MNTRSSSWHGRSHRSIESAFGPYARGPINPMPEREPLGHRVASALSAVIAVVMVGLLAWGVV